MPNRQEKRRNTMKRRILCVILALTAVMSVSACAGQPQATQTYAQQTTQDPIDAYQPPAQTYAQEAQEPVQTTAATTTRQDTLDDIGASFIGYPLDDVVRAFKDAKKTNLYTYESDNGKKIIVKNNWSVDSYYISNGKIVFVCTKFRNDGIIDAAMENADGISDAIAILKAF